MRRRQFIVGAAALGGAVALGPFAAGCSDSKSAKARELRADVPRATPGADAGTQAQALAAANARFGWDLYQRLIEKEKGNLFLSPYSIGMAMAMVQAGARGATARQLASALQFEALGGGLDSAFNGLDQAVSRTGAAAKDAQPFELSVANSSWAQAGFTFEQAYLDTLARYYGAGLRLVDFAKAPEEARTAVNDWVEQQTKERIKDLLPRGSVDSMTRLILANAIYFKADWQEPFKKEDTSPGPFTPTGGTAKQVPMMHQTASFPYAKGDGFGALELPYAGNAVSMVVLLPAGDIAALEGQLAAAAAGITPKLEAAQVRLTMPKWEFTSEFALRAALAALGVEDAFAPDRADFSGMDGRRDLYVSDVFHKAFVRVDEKGTEAAAATGVVVGATAAPAQPVTFTVDRPFVFFIRHRQTGAVLFAGRVMDPAT